MKKRVNIFFVVSVLSLIVCSILLRPSIKRRIIDKYGKNDWPSFYYRDTVHIDSLFPTYKEYDFSIENQSVIVNNRRFWFNSPEDITEKDVHINVKFYTKTDTIHDVMHSRCWIDDVYEFREEYDNKLYDRSSMKVLVDKIKRKYIYGSHMSLASLGDSLYFFSRGKVKMYTSGDYVECGKLILDDPEYIQLIRGGKYIFMRNNNKLIVTEDNFATSKTVYDERRGIKESMCWDPISCRLVFSMYTPGTERVRHYLLAYDPELEQIDTLQTFYTLSEHNATGIEPFCRHIHLISEDPYTGDIYIGVGDYHGESGIFRSMDGGITLQKVGQGSQLWRTLSFFYTKDYIYWTNDSESPQYINRLNRAQLNGEVLDSTDVVRFPLFNSAIWCNMINKDGMYILSSNSEGCFYDEWHRTYGIVFDAKGIPTVYNLFEERSLESSFRGILFHQLFPLACNGDIYYFYDTRIGLRKFSLGAN